MSLTDTRIRSLKPSERPYRKTDGGWAGVLEVKATELTSSNEEAFRHTSNVEIFLNGALFFNKSWPKTVPREHN